MGWFDWLHAGQSSVLSQRSNMSAQEEQGMLRSSLLDPGLQQAASCPASEASATLANEEQRYVLRRVRDNPMWTLDRGTGFYDLERRTKKKASLLGSGK
jgi:hypothetical protein